MDGQGGLTMGWFENLRKRWNSDIYDMEVENEYDVADVNRKYGQQKATLTKRVAAINVLRNKVYNETLSRFVELFGQIHNSKLVYNPKLVIKVNPQLEKLEAPPKLLDDEWHRNYSRGECEEIREDIEKSVKIRELYVLNLRSTNKFLQSVKTTIDTLNKLMLKAMKRLESIIIESGTDYNSYSSEIEVLNLRNYSWE